MKERHEYVTYEKTLVDENKCSKKQKASGTRYQGRTHIQTEMQMDGRTK